MKVRKGALALAPMLLLVPTFAACGGATTEAVSPTETTSESVDATIEDCASVIDAINQYSSLIEQAQSRDRGSVIRKMMAATWPKLSDPDLKTLAQAIANDENYESNMIALGSICFPDIIDSVVEDLSQ